MVPPHEQVVVSPLIVITVAVVVVVITIAIVMAIAAAFLGSTGTTSPIRSRRRHAEVESSGRIRRGRGGLLPREVGRWDRDRRFGGSRQRRRRTSQDARRRRDGDPPLLPVLGAVIQILPPFRGPGGHAMLCAVYLRVRRRPERTATRSSFDWPTRFSCLSPIAEQGIEWITGTRSIR